MRITFLMPGYAWRPSGGYKVVYQYANHLVSRDHAVSVIHPRVLSRASRRPLTLRRLAWDVCDLISSPSVDWPPLDCKVDMLYVPNAKAECLPDADVVFATAWNTVEPVLGYSEAKGKKCYLIQHYETWDGAKENIDATWLMPLSKVVVSRWLQTIARDLGTEAAHIPNGIDHSHYSLRVPLADRRRRVAMTFSSVAFKGAGDGIAALTLAREAFPDLTAVLFGAERRKGLVPDWIEYHCNPAQETITEIYNSASIFLSSSWSEGFALPPAEAGSCGCAIVATDSGGIRDYVEAGVTGLLSPPRDVKALAGNLCRLLGDDPLRLRLALNASNRLSEFTWERSTSQLERFIEVVMHAPSGTEPEPVGTA